MEWGHGNSVFLRFTKESERCLPLRISQAVGVMFGSVAKMTVRLVVEGAGPGSRRARSRC